MSEHIADEDFMSTTRNIRTWADYQTALKAGGVSQAEKDLVEHCQTGTACVLGNGKCPEGPSEARTIGADLLRYLIVGGCDGCELHDWGVQLEGAYVNGKLDLSFAKAVGLTRITNSRFEGPITALQAKLEFLNLSGSACTGLDAQGAEVKGGVFLRGGFSAKGEVSLAGAVIGGSLECDGSTFENEEGKAINAQGVVVKGDVFLRGGFSAKGEVSLAGAVIGGSLSCSAGTFENEEGKAINAQKAVLGALFWRGVTKVDGSLSLAGAKAGHLVDDAESWGKVSRVYLDGFEYKSIHGPLDEQMRLAWLGTAVAYDDSFSPQPYEQLAWVLKRMGHDEQRRAILVEKERLTRRAVRQRIMEKFSSTNPLAALHAGWLGFWGYLQWLVVGYGHRPFKSVAWLAVLFFVGTVVFHMAYEKGDFAPNSAVILSTQEWKDEAATAGNPAKTWSAKGAAGADYESFNRYAYAADIVVPIISLGQEEAWAPSTTRGPWGWHAWWARWVLKVMGWIVTALGAAAITGIIRRE